MDRPLRLAWWGTLAGLAALVFGLAVFFFYALSEVLANPGVSLVEGYWIGRLPWTGIAEGLTVMGATGAVVLGTLTVWIAGSRWRYLVLAPLAVAAFYLFVAMLPGRVAVPCTGCQGRIDPFAYAYSQPENAVIFLIVPALISMAFAFAAREGRAPQT